MSEKLSKSKNANKFIKLQILTFAIDTVILVAISLLCVSADLRIENALISSLAFIGVCSFISGFIAGIRQRKNGMITGVINALPFNCLIIIISLVLNGFKADLNLLFTLLTGVLLSAIGGIISVNLRLK